MALQVKAAVELKKGKEQGIKLGSGLSYEQESERVKQEIFPFLPESLRKLLSLLSREDLASLEEIRVRRGQPLFLQMERGSFFLKKDGGLTRLRAEGYMVTDDDLERILQLVSRSSLYAFEEELRRGYLTVKGGHRVGLCGRAVVEGGKVRTLKNFSSLNIRVAREKKGCGEEIFPQLFDGEQRFLHTLIISPPRCGKTTLLRDLVRLLSVGKGFWPGCNVGVVDERSEIAGCYQGVPQKDVGPRTDVLDGCPKAEGMMMMIRAMAPEVLVTDEVGRPEDVPALREALNAGIKVLTTAHGESLEEVARRPGIGELIREGFFQRYVILSRRRGPGTVEKVLDRVGQPLQEGGWISRMEEEKAGEKDAESSGASGDYRRLYSSRTGSGGELPQSLSAPTANDNRFKNAGDPDSLRGYCSAGSCGGGGQA